MSRRRGGRRRGAARTVLSEVSAATGDWRSLAREAGLRDVDLEHMAPAFEHEQAAIARDL